MALAFTRISLWLLGANGPKDDHSASSSSNNATHTLSSSFDFGLGFREPETNFRLSSRQRPPSSRRKWQSREERRRLHAACEEDIVVVPSDGGCCLSGSESDDSDWSIGWLEPHAPEFLSDAEDVDAASFAVIVPCYGRGRGGPPTDSGAAAFRAHENNKNITRNFFPAIDLTNSSETRKYMEDLLSAALPATT